MGKKERAPTWKKARDGRTELIILAQGIGLTGIISFVFYESLWGLMLFPAIYFLNRIRYGKKKEREAEEAFLKEYKDLLLSVTSSLQTGYSIENAFKESEKEIFALYGKDSQVIQGVKEINQKVTVAIPIEKAFIQFAEKHPYEEVLSFAEIFTFAKRLGGDYGRNIRNTALKIEEKIGMKQEIAMLTAEKRMEMNIMSVMPIAILLYVRLSSYSFLQGLYHNFIGVVAMSVCLLAYVIAIFVGNRIVEIKV